MVASRNDTVVTGIGASITDAGGSLWSINGNGQITVNGKVDNTTRNVDELAYYNGLVWQKNADNHWYSKTSPSAAWIYWSSAVAPVPIPHVSGNDATVAAGRAFTLVDANGNVWGLTKTSSTNLYQVTVDGAIDPTTANLVQIAIVNGKIWQENTAGLWYSKTTPASTWTVGTTTDPITGIPEPVSLTWVGGGNNLASNPADWSPAVAPKAGYTLTMGSGTMNVSGNALAGDTLSLLPFSTATLNATGTTNLKLSAVRPGSHANINIAAGGTLNLTAVIAAGSLNVSGPGTLAFIGTSAFDGFTTVVSNNIVGTGAVYLNGGNATGETMEIKGSVGSGLKFNVSAPGPCDAGLQIDHPAEFAGNVVLQSGYVAFMGIQATRGELLNGVLQMFNGTKLVDTTRFVSSPNDYGIGTLQMQQNSAGVMLSIGIGDDYQPGGIGKVLPLRT